MAPIGSETVALLEKAWGMLQKLYSDLPGAVMVLCGDTDRKKYNGYFLQKSWNGGDGDDGRLHEVAMSPNLFTSPENTLCTFVHEAAHALNCARGVKDTRPPKNKYHNANFKKTAEDMGLEVYKRGAYHGLAGTKWPDSGVPEMYSEILLLLKEGLKAYTSGSSTDDGEEKEKKEKKPNTVTLSCGCREIKVPRKVAENGDLMCGRCNNEFEVQEGDEESDSDDE